jgi:hypothetical protein
MMQKKKKKKRLNNYKENILSRKHTLQTVTRLSLLPDHVQHGVDELSALCVVSLGPVVTCP